MTLEADGKKLSLIAAGLPCRFGEASTKFPGFVGEAPRYPAVVLTQVRPLVTGWMSRVTRAVAARADGIIKRITEINI